MAERRMDFISRKEVLAIAKSYNIETLTTAIEALPYFPAPNPEMKDGRNIMGQTEDEFWRAVELQVASS